MKTGVELIAEERREQVEKHGWDVANPENEKWYKKGELKKAALHCLTLSGRYYPKSWGHDFSKKLAYKTINMTSKEFDIEMLKIAGALIAAEIDRLQSKK